MHEKQQNHQSTGKIINIFSDFEKNLESQIFNARSVFIFYNEIHENLSQKHHNWQQSKPLYHAPCTLQKKPDQPNIVDVAKDFVGDNQEKL